MRVLLLTDWTKAMMTRRLLPAVLISMLTMSAAVRSEDVVIADFESDGYGHWKVEGAAFERVRPTAASYR